MTNFKITNKFIKNFKVPEFSYTVEASNVLALYSDTEMQTDLLNGLISSRKAIIFDWRDGLYDRLTVEDNLAFYHKWFNCQTPLPEILVQFQLHKCAGNYVKKCSFSEIRRIYYAKYFMGSTHNKPLVFLEPVHGVDVLTMDTFLNMISELQAMHASVLVLVTNLEHALLIGNQAFKMNENGLHTIEMEENGEDQSTTQATMPTVVNLYKIPAKVDDKVILFDPTEIDYIESQEGKAQIVINKESFALDSTLAEIEKKLEVYGFFRCHRSYIVNLQKVREIITWSKNTYSLKIDNQVESTIPLSRTKIQEIQGIFNLK